MTKTTRAIFVTSILLLGAFAAHAGALPVPPGIPAGGIERGGVVVRADWFGREGTTLYAVGNVRLQRGRASVTADAAVVWANEREAYLEGNVVYRIGRTSVTTDRAYVHWSVSVDAVTGKAQTDMDRAFFLNGDIRWHETPTDVAWRVRADEILQTDVLNFVARGHAFVTPNTFHSPHTYFRAKEIELIVDERLILTSLTYHVQGVALPPGLQGWWIPPTYWPKLYIPLSWEWPEMSFDFGDSRWLGTYLLTRVVYDVPEGLIPLIQSKVGVNIDYYSQRGFAYGGDFRYRYQDSVLGRLDLYRVPNDKGEDRDSFELGTTDRYRARFFHTQDVIDPDGTRGWEFDVEWQDYSDAGFRQEFFRDDYEDEKPVENRLYFKIFDGPFAAYAHWRTQGDEWRDTTEYMPQIGANVFSLPIWGGLVYSGNVEFAYVRRELSNLRMSPDTMLVAPDEVDERDDDEDFYDDNGDLTDWDDLNDRRDLAAILGEDHSLVRKLRDDNFLHFPHRSTAQEEESDGESFWRFNMYHELALPFEQGIFDIEPFIATRQTYYGESIGGGNEWRSIFVVGGRAATQFWTTWDDAKADSLRLFGLRVMPLEVNGLRHIVTPELRVMHTFKPSTEPDELILTDDTDTLQPIADGKFRHFARRYHPRDPVGLAFGDVDAIEGITTVSLGLRNRWQTRREQIIFTEDLLAEKKEEMTEEELAAMPEVIRREFIVNFLDVDAEINIHRFDNNGPFDEVLDDITAHLDGITPPDIDDFGDQIIEFRLDTRFRPITGVTLYNDFEWNLSNGGSADEGIGAFNTGLRLATSDWWELILTQRYELDETSRYGARISFVPSPKWRISVQYVYDTERSDNLDFSVHITRDLRDWVAEIGFEDDKELGAELIALRLRPKLSKRQLIRGLYFRRELGAGAFGDGTENYVQYDY